MRILRIPYTSQPPKSAPLRSDISRELAFAYVGDEVERTQNNTPDYWPGLRGTTKLGVAVKTTSGTANLSFPESKKLSDISGAHTWLYIGTYDGRQTSNPGMFSRRNGWSNGAVTIYRKTGTESNQWFAVNKEGGLQEVGWAIGTPDTGSLYYFCHVTNTTTDHISYSRVNGATATKVLTSSTTIEIQVAANVHPIVIGANDPVTGANRTYGKHHFAMVWDRALTAMEVEQIFNNPYSMFEPRVLYLPASAAAAYPYQIHKHRKGGMNVLLTM